MCDAKTDSGESGIDAASQRLVRANLHHAAATSVCQTLGPGIFAAPESTPWVPLIAT